MNFFLKTKKNKGFTLIEALFYLAIFLLMSIAITNSLIVLMRTFTQISLNNQLAQSYLVAEKLAQVVRDSSSVNLDNGNINLTKNESGVLKNIVFELSSTDLRMYENGVLLGNLNTLNIDVESFNNEIINTGRGVALKNVISVSHKNDPSSRILYYYNTVILKGSY